MTRLRSFALAAVAFAGFATLALVGQAPPPTGAKMADAAKKFLAALAAEQKAKAAFAFDDKSRTAWFFTPQQDKDKKPTRKGLRLEEMNADQKAAAMELLKSGLSSKGYEQAVSIMSLESLLNDLEKGTGPGRNPNWYFVSVYGEPGNTGRWGWRIEGHHLSVNYTLDKGEVVSATPLQLASNPAEVKDGAKKGLRVIPEVEDHARALIKSLNPDQDKVAKQAKDFPEIREGFPKAGVGDPVGIVMAKLADDQKATLVKLLQAYADRMPEALGAAEMKVARATPADKLYFAYSGSPEPGKPYTYRIHAPEFVVEFLNVQADSAKNPANHIHSAWRKLPSDFALTE